MTVSHPFCTTQYSPLSLSFQFTSTWQPLPTRRCGHCGGANSLRSSGKTEINQPYHIWWYHVSHINLIIYIYAEYLWIIPRVTMTWCRPWRRSSCSSSIIWRRVLHIMEWWFPSTLLHLVIPAEDVLFLELHTIHLPLIIAHQLCGQFRGYSLEFCCSRPMLGKQTICRWITCRKSASSHLVQLIHLGALAVEDMRHDMTYEESIGIQRIHLSYPCLKQHIDQEFSADKRHFLSKCGVFERW